MVHNDDLALAARLGVDSWKGRALVTGSQTDFPALMIDAAGSLDRDDAIRVQALPDGGWDATVYVAAAAAHVRSGDAADIAAARVGSTRYLPKKTVPMLGREIEQAATLTYAAAREALAVSMRFSTDATVVSTHLTRTVLPAHSCVAITHSQAVAALDDPEHRHHRHLSDALRLAQSLTAVRRASGAFVLYDLTRGLVTSEDGSLIAVPSGQKAAAYLIVQELMIAANQAVAEWAISADAPILFRNHRRSAVAPDTAIRMDQVAELLASATTQAQVAAAREQINLTVSRATYDATVSGHYGLQVRAYTHATSPLRRYADLVTQRVVLASLAGEATPYTPSELASIAQALTDLDVAKKEKAAEAYKQRSRRVTAAAIAEDSLAGLDDRAWRRVLKMALATAPPAAVVTELNARANAGRLHAGHVALLLLADADGWVPIRAQVFAVMRSGATYQVASILLAWQQAQGLAVQPAEFESQMVGPAHEPRFAVRAHLNEVYSDWAVGSSKKAAEQEALWDVLETLGHHRASADPSTAAPLPVEAARPSRPTSDAMASPQEEDQSADVGEDRIRVVLGTTAPQWSKNRENALTNPVSWLHSFTGKLGVAPPRVEHESEGPDHQPTFTVTVTVPGAVGDARGSSIKATKVAAARDAVERLFDTHPAT